MVRNKTPSIQQLCYILPLLKGIIYPLFKVSLVALAEKVLREALRLSISPSLFAQFEEAIFGGIESSGVLQFFLLTSLSFAQTFAVTVSIALVLACIIPLYRALDENYLNYIEVKRIQGILYERFILDTNSVAIQEASDLMYTKIASVEKYWSSSKYKTVDDITSILSGLTLLLILAWDLGLMTLGATILIVFVAALVWKKMSTPWSEQRELKAATANAQLLDLVNCKDVIRSHAKENIEGTALKMILDADHEDIKMLAWAKLVSEFVKYFTFTMVTPLLFVFVFFVDPTLERVFELFIILVVSDDMTRAYVQYLSKGPIDAEYNRAKNVFCRVLGVDEAALFPPTITFPRWFPSNKRSRIDIELGLPHPNQSSYKGLNPDPSSAPAAQVLPQKVVNALRTPSDKDSNKENSHNLCMEAISFGYKMADGTMFNVMNNLNLSFQLGHHYAIMGETGAGKSTIFKILSGLVQPVHGRIVVNGEAVDPTSRLWREQVGVVSQDSVLFNRTIRENLEYGMNPDVVSTGTTETDLWRVLEQVKMDDRVRQLPMGLDTMIHDSGHEFSGGQRQRLQIARLLLRSSCSIVLLDECTSALDTETAEDILQILTTFLIDKTLVMVTHDTQTLCLADTVLNMKVGGIIEDVTAKMSKSLINNENVTKMSKSLIDK